MTTPEFKLCDAYLRLEKKLLKSYPQAKDSFQKKYDAIIQNPEIGDAIPGFSAYGVRKTRIGAPCLRMGQSDGFRLIYMVGPTKVIPVFIYKKGKPEREDKIRAKIAELLEEIFAELESEQT